MKAPLLHTPTRALKCSTIDVVSGRYPLRSASSYFLSLHNQIELQMTADSLYSGETECRSHTLIALSASALNETDIVPITSRRSRCYD